MAPTPLPGGKTQRFSPRGRRVTLWIPVVAGFDAGTGPILSEIDGATDLSCQIAAQAGWTESTTFTETPDQCSQVAGKIPDGVTLDDSSITFYGAKNGEDAGDFFSRGMSGFVAQAWYGLEEDLPWDIFATEVGSVSMTPDITGAQQITVSFALTAEPLRRLVIPALTTP